MITAAPGARRIRASSLAEAYDALQSQFAGEVPLAVRSSATAEDLPDASFAGQQDTYLWLDGFDAVREHIRACWASLYTSRAIIYRLKNDIPDEGLSMAVVVQKMVNAAAAGVAMTWTRPTATAPRSPSTPPRASARWSSPARSPRTTSMLDKVTLPSSPSTSATSTPSWSRIRNQRTWSSARSSEERRAVRCLTDAELKRRGAAWPSARRSTTAARRTSNGPWMRTCPTGENLLLLQSRPETVHSLRTHGTQGHGGGYASQLGLGTSRLQLRPLDHLVPDGQHRRNAAHR